MTHLVAIRVMYRRAINTFDVINSVTVKGETFDKTRSSEKKEENPTSVVRTRRIQYVYDNFRIQNGRVEFEYISRQT